MDRTLTAGLLFVAFGLGFSLIFALPFLRSFKTRRWPSVPGRIYSARIRENYNVTERERHYKPDIRYEYRVAGKAFRGKRLGIYAQSNAGYVFATTAMERYAEGTAVTVYYNPANPADAVLIQGPEYQALIGVIVPWVFVGFGAFILSQR